MFSFSRCLQRPLVVPHSSFAITRPVQRASAPFIRSLTTPSHPTSSTQADADTPHVSPLRPEWVLNSTTQPQQDQAQQDQEQSPLRWVTVMSEVKTSLQKDDSPSNPQNMWQSRERSLVVNLPKPDTPFSGRSMHVSRGGVAQAFAKLDFVLKANNIKAEARAALRHEKKGEKRRRLKSLRWRRLFAHEVRKKVQLVNEIRARGA